ncbi:MAG: VWA domain-containing protein [Bryobacterales bacterium]
MRTLRSLLASAVLVSAVGLVILLTPQPGPSQGVREESPLFRVKVDLVVLNVAITDRRGRYIRDLAPGDFRVFEDGIPQQIATFAEGNEAPRAIGELAAGGGSGAAPAAAAPTPDARIDGPSSLVDDTFVGTNVFVLFDTSNFMYRSFVYAEDAIADFIRGLDTADSVAVYGFSRNLTRHSGLTPTRLEAIKALRLSVAGDETALYNSLLLTLRDAARVPGRKVVIVFSNGPDNASTIAPDDVGAIAEDEGIPIYVISTNELNKDPISSNVFRRLTARTGGKAYFAKTWQRQSEAFTSIREELASSYTLTYYPQPNPNGGWRSITVDLVGDALKRHRIRTRSGYRPKL